MHAASQPAHTLGSSPVNYDSGSKFSEATFGGSEGLDAGITVQVGTGSAKGSSWGGGEARRLSTPLVGEEQSLLQQRVGRVLEQLGGLERFVVGKWGARRNSSYSALGLPDGGVG